MDKIKLYGYVLMTVLVFGVFVVAEVIKDVVVDKDVFSWLGEKATEAKSTEGEVLGNIATDQYNLEQASLKETKTYEYRKQMYAITDVTQMQSIMDCQCVKDALASGNMTG